MGELERLYDHILLKTRLKLLKNKKEIKVSGENMIVMIESQVRVFA